MSVRLFILWIRRVAITFPVLIFLTWLMFYADQWWVRYKAHVLLSNINSIEIGTMEAQSQQLIQRWNKTARHYKDCVDSYCSYRVYFQTFIPDSLVGSPDEDSHNWLHSIVGHLGLRRAGVSGGLSIQNGVVTEKWFAEETGLPVRVWYDRDGAYVPELAVSSNETSEFSQYWAASPYPNRIARRIKGPYGIRVSFSPQEFAAERAVLMDFQTSCITRLKPCMNEREILPEAAALLNDSDEHYRRPYGMQ